MDTIFPVAKLHSLVLIMNKSDVPFIGKERALEVMCVQVDLEQGVIYPVHELEKHLKFNPWEETTDQEKETLSQKIQETVSEKDIEEKIVKPLTACAIK